MSESCPRATGDRPWRANTRHFLAAAKRRSTYSAWGMQRVIKLSWGPEQYAEMGLERTVGRPALCPNCERSGTLEAHGYYCRWVSVLQQVGRLVQIRVRRFFVATASAP